MAFSTWSALAAKMRDDYASGEWRTRSYEFDGMRKEFFSPAEFLQVLNDVETRAREEKQADNATWRTSARAGDR